MKRYPGIRSFTAEDQHLFKGREKESRDLFQLIVLNEVVVLFGKSGTGKTSLLQAGVCPELEDRSLHPVFIRLNQTQLKPEEQIYQNLKDHNYIPKDMPAGLTLWEYLKAFYYVDLGEIFNPVIVLDQFEELFTLHKPQDRVKFVTQFADVLNGHFPESLKGRTDEHHLETPPKVKFVISIRSDYLYLLDELSAEIPAILRIRFQLKMLNRSNATDAINLPAAERGTYDSPSFSYSQQAIDNIIDTLGKEERDQLRSDKLLGEPEIEAFQLQLFCGQVECRLIADGKPQGFQVKPDYYGGANGIQEIISHFYENVLAKVDEPTQVAVEKLLALGLIRNKRRIIMEESLIKEEYGVSKELLELLNEERLLNKETRKGNFYYEIAHDTLVEPVLEKYQAIAEKEEQERLIAEREEREAELAVERKKRKRTMGLAIVGFTLAAISLVAMFIVIQQAKDLEQSRNIIYEQQYDQYIDIAKRKKVEGNYEAAMDYLLRAEEQTINFKSIKKDEHVKLEVDWITVQSLMEQGDSLAYLGDYYNAISFYNKASKVAPDDRILKLEEATKVKLEDEFNEWIRKAEVFQRGSLGTLAKEAYQEALKLKPNHPETVKKLNELTK